MIRNQWYAVLSANEVKKGKLNGVTRLGERLLFWRNEQGEVICLQDVCVHRGAALSLGTHCGDAVMCPFHGFLYDRTGKVTQIPANGKNTRVPDSFRVRSYPVREYHGMIFIWWGDSYDHLPEVQHFDDMNETFSGYISVHHWHVHYSRAIENQLDLVHLPYVHRKTIGRGNRTLVNGPVQIAQDGYIQFWVYNEVDDGQTPRRSNQLPPPDSSKQHIHFIFPNIWQNWISPSLRIFVAFVPVDDENTLIYLRTCQLFNAAPGLKQIINWVNRIFSDKVLREDERVVRSQIPIRTDLRMDEKLIPGDLPIITYRKMRDELKSKNNILNDIPDS
jgi:phenylpropionate dioxygenase-like ring-hydroxylating dioxygenase large terminal subunit